LGDRTIISQLEDGFIYRSKSEAPAALQRCLQHFDPSLPCHGNNQRHWLRDVERQATGSRCLDRGEEAYLGEAAISSAAWTTLRALALLQQDRPRLLIPVLGSTHQIGALEIKYQHPIAD
jgi:hypothetical protein